MGDAQTIVAPATPAGRGAIGVVRVSGPLVDQIAVALLGRLPQPRCATHARFIDAQRNALDEGLALYFPGPRSFTGEDVLELQGHGSPVVIEQLVARIIELGARRAEPGEFTQRAFVVIERRLRCAGQFEIEGIMHAGILCNARKGTG